MSSTSPQIGSIPGKPNRDLWLNGDVLACACPDCGGPMSIRVWLMTADCPLCSASIELTPEQRRQAEKLLGRKLDPVPPAPPNPLAPPIATLVKPSPSVEATHQPPPAPMLPPTIPQKKPTIPVAKLVKPGPSIPPPLPTPTRSASEENPALPPTLARSASEGEPPPPLPTESELPPPPKRAEPPPLPPFPAATSPAAPKSARRPRVPLWPFLLLLCAAGAAYGLWSLVHNGDKSPAVADQHTNSIPARPMPPSKWQTKRESRHLPTPKFEDLKAERAADELTLPRDAAGLPELPKVVATVKTPSADRMLEGRDPRIRTDIVEEEGGSIQTEAAVAAGLRWLARHQSSGGQWQLDRFSHAGDCNGQCDGEGMESNEAATALALLPFLGAGQSHKLGLYQDAVDRGLKWLVSRQRADGSLMGNGGGRMYAHGIATIVLCEAVAMSGDNSFRPAAQRAIDFIAGAQHDGGGWRYYPGEEGDTSVVGWQLMALQSGKIAYLKVPKSAFERAGRFLDTVKIGRRGGLFSYQPGRGPSAAMTAEGLLCRQYLGWKADNRGLREGISRLLEEEMPSADQPNIYYWYYATQVMHHVGGDAWKKWNAAVRDALLSMQDKEGHRAGSWAPQGGAIGDADTRQGGRIYMTSLALCTLEVYYRYLPLYRGIEIE